MCWIFMIFDFLVKQSSWANGCQVMLPVHSRGTRNLEMGGAKGLMMKIFRAQAWHETGMLATKKY